MNHPGPGSILLHFASLSLLAVGGATAVLPEARRQIVVELAAMSPADFTSAFALAQAAPGPNVIFFSLLGWKLSGWAGFAAATIGILGPSVLLAFFVARGLNLAGERMLWPARLRRALAPLAIGLMFASGWLLARWEQGAMTALCVVAAGGFAWKTNRNPLFAIGAGALLFVIAGRLGAAG